MDSKSLQQAHGDSVASSGVPAKANIHSMKTAESIRVAEPLGPPAYGPSYASRGRSSRNQYQIQVGSDDIIIHKKPIKTID